MHSISEPSEPVEGPAVYYDGATSARKDVRLSLDPAVLIHAADGDTLAEWPWDRLRRVAGGSDDVLRLSCTGAAPLARLEIRDPALRAAVLAGAGGFAAHDAIERRGRLKIAAWFTAAAVSLVLVGIYGIPAIADRLAPLLPWSFDEQLGRAFDGQVKYYLSTDDRGDRCGTRTGERDGQAALDKMVATLEREAGLPVGLKVIVMPNGATNAFATPGGYIYILLGLIEDAETPDEVAGVLAHEIGHVAARDGTRKVLQTTGVSFLFGMVLGDFTGGGALVVGTQALTESAYSREAETRADAFAVDLMSRAGANPSGLAAFFRRIAKDEGNSSSALQLLSSHPLTPDRIRMLESAGAPAANRPILDNDQWRALKTICGEGE